VRILVIGAGVIGSVYAGKLLAAGHEVVLLARGRRVADLGAFGLILEEAKSGQRTALPVTAVAALDPADRYDVVVVPVRAEQLTSTLPLLSSMRDASDVLFFGNIAGRQAQLVEALGSRVLFGFPAVGGTRDGAVVRYVLIDQQQTMLGEPGGAITSRVRHLKTMLKDAGFPTRITTDMDGWLLGHAAFVVPIAFALYRVGTDASRLAADRDTLKLMVRATRQAFQALRASRNSQIPANLRILYLRLPAAFAVGYWRRVLVSCALNSPDKS
jgi:2-dehydropantoate 2-reductase